MAWADFQDSFISWELGKPGTLTKQTHSRKPTAKVESQDISGGNESRGGNKTLGEHFQWLREREKMSQWKPILAKIFWWHSERTFRGQTTDTLWKADKQGASWGDLCTGVFTSLISKLYCVPALKQNTVAEGWWGKGKGWVEGVD